MRIVFMGTPDFAVPSLQELHKAGFEIAAVVTQPDRPRGRGHKIVPSPVKAASLELDFPVLQPETVQDPAFLDKLKEIAPEAIVVVAFGQILPPAILDLPPKGCINLHASLLPYYRGAAPIHWAVINGETESGITTMYMDRGMDTGDMILLEKVPIGTDDTAGALHDRLAETGAGLLVKTMNLIASGMAPRQPQDHEKATYAPMILREHETIDWKRPAQAIANQVRGMEPWPGAYTFVGGKILKIWRAGLPENRYVGPSLENVTPGQVVEAGHQGILVQAGDGPLLVSELQLQGGKRLAAADFLRGNPLAPGTLLGGGPS